MIFQTQHLNRRSKDLRQKSIDILQGGRRGHIGATFSLIEIVQVLYDDILRYDVKKPNWVDRDRCILSKGHGCVALYAMLHEKGFIPDSEMTKFCRFDGVLGGHPEHKVSGIEASTGSLGHGLSMGLGMALSAKGDKKDYRVFVIVGDGECNEGSIWEAALCARKHALDNLVVVVDYNKHQSYGPVDEVLGLEPFADKWRAFGFGVREVDGHDPGELKAAFKKCPFIPNRPSVLICHTVKGKGVAFAENNMAWHHKSKISDEEIQQLRNAVENYP